MKRTMNDAIQTTTEEQHQWQLLFRNQLRNEEPKLDAALKSFASLLVASSSSSSSSSPAHKSSEEGCWSLTECLNVTRLVSKHMNQHIVAIGTAAGGRSKKRQQQQQQQQQQEDQQSNQKKEIAAQVWNEVVASQQKPTKSLGRTSLQLIWQDLELERALLETKPSAAASSQQDDSTASVDFNHRVHQYVQRFETLLFASIAHQEEEEEDRRHPDAPLLWHADRGAAELARRAAGRQERAAARLEQEQQQVQQQQQNSENAATPFIEELAEEQQQQQDDEGVQETKDSAEN